ncbi:PLC-like phosphodiesterase [Ascodesmis nigricans]|uniref:PLC-like phosphodiesterase n=1 Tax=Ascodesmis nigricans TaxID=341454 RepID=A0A4S2MMF3_9PEZI|nr:PLC-like phosphodiesterase [Ascodesmis nigricans]
MLPLLLLLLLLSTLTPATLLNLTTHLTPLPPSTPLSFLHLAGTHNTLSFPPLSHPHRHTTPFSLTHDHPLRAQLHLGIRFLDLRLHHTNNHLHPYHGPERLPISLDEVFDTLATFLVECPGETVIARIAENTSPFHRAGVVREETWVPPWRGKRLRPEKEGEEPLGGYNTRGFNATLWWHLEQRNVTEFIWTPARPRRIPTLGEVRGKIVVLQDFPGAWERGLPFWDGRLVMVQDVWRVGSIPRKLEVVRRFWVKMAREREKGEEGKLVVSFVSGSFCEGLVPPRWVAERLWEVVWGWFGGERSEPRESSEDPTFQQFHDPTSPENHDIRVKPIGMVVGDFLTAAIIRSIVRFNYEPGGPGEGLGVETGWEKWRAGGWRRDTL